MKIGRIQLQDGRLFLARLEDDKCVLLREESNHPAADVLCEALMAGIELDGDGHVVDVEDVLVRSPLARPGKFLGVGLNFADHAAEAQMDLPLVPKIFVKTSNTIRGPGEVIRVVADAGDTADFEVELVVVIGARCGPSDPSSSANSILGFTVGNDVTSRSVQFSDGQWVRSKSFDSFGPIGPWIVTADELDIGSLRMTSRLNGQTFQAGTTEDMIFSPSEIVGFLTKTMTLDPGDVITTGTPAGVGMSEDPPRYLRDGDLVEVSIEGIGVLRNPVEVEHASERV